MTDGIADRVGDGRNLLVLDNCEHVIEDVAELAARLVRSSTELTIIGTSREPLGIAGEHVVTVEPLDIEGDVSGDAAACSSSASGP